MAEKMLYVLAGYDDSTREYLSGIQQQLYAQGFCGTHTKNIPQHITLGSFPTEREEELKQQLKQLARQVQSFEVTFNHIGLFWRLEGAVCCAGSQSAAVGFEGALWFQHRLDGAQHFAYG